MDSKKQLQNEKQFKNWDKTSEGGRIYWYEVAGKHGWKARYVKEVNAEEETRVFGRKFMMKTVSWWKFIKNFQWTLAIKN